MPVEPCRSCRRCAGVARRTVGVSQQLAVGGLLRLALVSMEVVAEVLALLLGGLVLAIRRRCRPGELERQKQRNEDDE